MSPVFNVDEYSDVIDKKEARRLDPFEQFAVATASQALKDSNLTIDDSNRDDIGVLIGTGIGGLVIIDQGYKTLNEKGPMRVSPFTGALMIPNMAGGQVAITFGAAVRIFALPRRVPPALTPLAKHMRSSNVAMPWQ